MRQLMFLLGILIFCTSGCKKESNSPVESSATSGIDLSVNKSWTYSWSYVFANYDSSKINSSYSDTFLVRIASIDDSLNGYNHLIRFEAQSVPHYMGISRVWYQNAGDSLVEIAYDLPISVPTILPKVKTKLINDKLNLSVPFSLFPKTVLMVMQLKGISDTTIFRDEIRIVYKFPLSFGKKWTSFTLPFLQTREVVGVEQIITAGHIFNCTKIQTSILDFGPSMKWYDFIAHEGLIERRFQFDSLIFTTSTNPDSGSYGFANETLKLMNLGE